MKPRKVDVPATSDALEPFKGEMEASLHLQGNFYMIRLQQEERYIKTQEDL